jgi:2'-5' RNA ligase
VKRLFFALWPDQVTRAKIDLLNQSLFCKHLKKVRPSNLHVTLAFMGRVDEKIERSIRGSIPDITAEQITIFFDQLTSWSDAGVLCLTSSKQPQQIIDLVEQLKIVMGDCGVEVDSRPYTAHVTLARKVQPNPTTILTSIYWHAISFALVESVSTPRGVDYQVLESWPLGYS